ncbi:MAG: TetR/AcrR family transcriptional regulator [Spirochaetales bacterium]
MSEKARAHLLEAFWDLYRQSRIDQITVKEVAAKAGYNRSTFYEHFDDVHQCLHEIEQLCLPNLDELPPTLLSAEPSPDFLQTFLAVYEAKAAYYNVLLGVNGDPSFRRRLIDQTKAAFLGKEGASEKGTALLPEDPLERDLALEYRIAGLLGVLTYCSTHPELASREAVARAIFRVLG